MTSFRIRENLAHVAVALLLATPATAVPSRLIGRECLANMVSDLSCADSSIMTRCIAIETVDVELLATCLEAAGCTTDEAENALWITEHLGHGDVYLVIVLRNIQQHFLLHLIICDVVLNRNEHIIIFYDRYDDDIFCLGYVDIVLYHPRYGPIECHRRKRKARREVAQKEALLGNMG
ncbi:hypothetical protein UCDDA912_g01224 [Diaporthe ampelina]|uniref:Uncharacterized protein n=1 Tax=Diaporthe ampelina TaxID=1214573 RepID=A0A0G2FY12_9PEZI|nr:hypothetical protein UCDDA912_g01224 [Diaporthe ampelina]